MRRKQPTMWYKASIVAEVDSVKKYMSGRLAKMLVARLIVVNLQGCSSHSATSWQILQRLKGSCLPNKLHRWDSLLAWQSQPLTRLVSTFFTIILDEGGLT